MISSVHIFIVVVLPFFPLIISEETFAAENGNKKKQDFYCLGLIKYQLEFSNLKNISFSFLSACKSMSETIFHEMNSVDPNERVQVGSYRVDGHGHQQLKEVTLNYFFTICL